MRCQVEKFRHAIENILRRATKNSELVYKIPTPNSPTKFSFDLSVEESDKILNTIAHIEQGLPYPFVVDIADNSGEFECMKR